MVIIKKIISKKLVAIILMVKKVYRYKIAKVLDSEKNYYSNVAQTGLERWSW